MHSDFSGSRIELSASYRRAARGGCRGQGARLFLSVNRREQLMKSKEDGGLGFRDIHHFNLAMLAKQVWRLVQNPDSLCARVLKVKYFPSSSVLEARQKPGMSYTWRSILRGIEIVKMGMIWRVGNGEGLHIWEDPWLPRDSVRTPITPRGATLLTEVQELLDPVTGSWDNILIRDIFWEEDAEIILAIPVHGGRAKTLAWHFDKHGRFSVKSAYKVSREIAQRTINANGGQGGSSSGGSTVWKRMWKLNCPSKVKHFLWRLSHNSHPLKGNLVRRGMQIDTFCPVCGSVGEDGGHLYFKCKLAKQLWRLLKMEEERRHLAAIPDAYAAVEFILCQKGKKRELMVITLSFIWSERNKIREEGKRRPAEVIVRCIETFANENVQSLNSTQNAGTTSRMKWSKPPVDVLKLNVDGSFKQIEKDGSWGFIIRDSDGEVVLAGRGKVDHLLNAFQAELIACLQGLQGAADLGIANIMLETDAQEVATVLNSAEYDDSVMGHIIEEIKFQARQNFSYFSCTHVSRSCNSAAHELANLGYPCTEGKRIIADSVPDDIAVIVASELLAI